ncbi:flavonoid 3'-monooxygenase-like isoform X1 [Primulina huaijiensis]|uniref:flavonoid 3'-monooxygenase-like isoform X1 n=2 Tax=Primulina huaijiensis TaxID=1492673 RepID=UPI003CC741B0
MFSSTLTLITCTSILGFLLYSFLHSRWLKDPRRQLPPGPRPWPIVGNLLQLGPMPHRSLAELARVHGPLMHLKLGSVHSVVASSASVAEQFLKVHDSNFLSRPPNSAAKYFAYNYQDLVFTSYGPRWRLLRKICALHLFSAKALDNFVNVRQEEVLVLSGALARAIQTPVDLGQMINTCTTNAISRVILGRRLVDHVRGRADTKGEEVKALVSEVTMLAGMFVISDFIPLLKGLDVQGVVKKLKVGHKRFDSFLNAMIEDRKIDGPHGREGHVDLLSILISPEVEDDGTKEERPTPTEIKALFLVCDFILITIQFIT